MRIDRYHLDEWEVNITERSFLLGVKRLYWALTIIFFCFLTGRAILLGDISLFGLFVILMVLTIIFESPYAFLPSLRVHFTLSGFLIFMMFVAHFYETFRQIQGLVRTDTTIDMLFQVIIAALLLIRGLLVMIAYDYVKQHRKSVIPITIQAKERLDAFYGVKIDISTVKIKSEIFSAREDLNLILLGSLPIWIILFLSVIVTTYINLWGPWANSAQKLGYEPIFLTLICLGFIFFVFTHRKIKQLAE